MLADGKATAGEVREELADLTASEAARGIRDAEFSSEDLVRACLARIEAREPEVQAWVHLDPDLAINQAKARDVQRIEGLPVGPLHGVPVAIKDIVDTRAWPTENGCALDAGRQPAEDATLISYLAAAGAVIMGKTVTTELAVLHPGKTRNPHNPAHTPGGSSSGSAAAVASGMVPLAVGSQTNGSVIRPASYCGVFGFKPTHGRISRAGVLSMSRFLDHIGVFARSVEDIALIGDALMHYDQLDPDMVPMAAPRLAQVTAEEPPVDPKFLFVKTFIWDRVEEDAKAGFEELAETLGEACEEVGLPESFRPATTHLGTIMDVDIAQSYAPYHERGADQLSDTLRSKIKAGRDIKAVDYLAARGMRARYTDLFEELFEAGDFIITPATLGTAPDGLETTGDPAACSLWTLCGMPALTIPLLVGANELPIGVQIVGQAGDDARLLRAARWLVTHLSSLDA